MLCGVEIMMNEAKRIEEHVQNRKMPLENIQENARKFYQQCATNFTRLQACEESGAYQVAEVHGSADQLARACVELYDLTEGEVVADRFDSFSRGIINVHEDFKVCALQYFKGFLKLPDKISTEANLYEFDLRRARDPVSLSIEPLTKYVLSQSSNVYLLTYLDPMDNRQEVHKFGSSPSYWEARDFVRNHIKENLSTFLNLAKSPRK